MHAGCRIRTGTDHQIFFFEESRTSRRACASQPALQCVHPPGSPRASSREPRSEIPGATRPRYIFEQSSSELAQANSCQQLLTARFSPVLERSGPPQSVGRSPARSLFASAEAAELGGAQRGGRKQLDCSWLAQTNEVEKEDSDK